MKRQTQDKIIIVFYTICVLMLIWILFSWVDVIHHNALGDSSYQYWVFNFFRLFERSVR